MCVYKIFIRRIFYPPNFLSAEFFIRRIFYPPKFFIRRKPYSLHVVQICPMLALAMLLTTIPMTGMRDNGRILPRETFRKALTNLLHVKRDTSSTPSGVEQRRINFLNFLDQEGIPYECITTHSYRKGAASKAASGSTASPSIIAIIIRAGWKLPGVLNRYLILEKAGDQFVGRVTAGLPLMTNEFGVLPPRFRKNLTVQEIEYVNKWYRTTFPNDAKWGSHMKAVCRNIFPSLIYHKDFLNSLPPSHPWHATPLGMSHPDMEKLHSLVELKFDGDGRDCRYGCSADVFSADFCSGDVFSADF